jgi:hypothetical protein
LKEEWKERKKQKMKERKKHFPGHNIRSIFREIKIIENNLGQRKLL